jgi:hypothetical protein
VVEQAVDGVHAVGCQAVPGCSKRGGAGKQGSGRLDSEVTIGPVSSDDDNHALVMQTAANKAARAKLSQ